MRGFLFRRLNRIFTLPLMRSSSQNLLSHYIFQDYFSYQNIPIYKTEVIDLIQQLIRAKLCQNIQCHRDNIPTLI